MSGALYLGGVMTVNLTLYVFAIFARCTAEARYPVLGFDSYKLLIDSYKCRSTVNKGRSTVTSGDQQIHIHSYKCQSTVISVDRQLSPSTVIIVDDQLITVQVKKEVLLMALTSQTYAHICKFTAPWKIIRKHTTR